MFVYFPYSFIHFLILRSRSVKAFYGEAMKSHVSLVDRENPLQQVEGCRVCLHQQSCLAVWWPKFSCFSEQPPLAVTSFLLWIIGPPAPMIPVLAKKKRVSFLT